MKSIEEMDFAEGEVLLFNKPKTWSSFDVVKKVRSTIRIKKVGHAGTLDPLATGLLIVCSGRKTKTIQSIQDTDKEYLATICLGAITKSYDLEHSPEDEKDVSHITREMVEEKLKNFRGDLDQYPPIFSAVKIKGRRAYKFARKGKDVVLPPRKVTISTLEITDYQGPEKISLLVRCTKGTYIRSLAHDLGQVLGVGGYLSGLIRTKIGEHSLENAWEIADFSDKVFAHRKANPPTE